jgi:hypothetical protein
MRFNKGNVYFITYIIFALSLGFYYWRNTINLYYLSSLDPFLRFSIRFLFGLGYLALAILYCKLSQKPLHLLVVSQIYLLSELSILVAGLVRYFIIDAPIIISLYSTLLDITVSPLGLLLTHVIISINHQKPLTEQ